MAENLAAAVQSMFPAGDNGQLVEINTVTVLLTACVLLQCRR
jgi:hypothetical protein